MKSLNTLRLLLFDFDGVLADSNDVHLEVCRRALREAGITREISDGELTCHFGKPYLVVLREVMGSDFTPERLEKASRLQLRLLYSDWFMQQITLVDGTENLLSELKEKGFKVGVASGNDRRFLEKALSHLGIDDFFDVVVSSDDVRNSKPEPDMILKAMRALGVREGETVYIGDSQNDIIAAKKAGVKSIFVLSGILKKEKAEELGPDLIVDSIRDIKRFL